MISAGGKVAESSGNPISGDIQNFTYGTSEVWLILFTDSQRRHRSRF